MQTEQLLFWSVMTDTEHAISSSNGEDCAFPHIFQRRININLAFAIKYDIGFDINLQNYVV